MRIKIGELNGVRLDWAVAKANGVRVLMSRGWWCVFDSDVHPEFCNEYNDSKMQSFKPSTNWAQGGPIIEREGIALGQTGNGWEATCDGCIYVYGPTPLIAAMRCYVASKLGDEVEVPDEVCEA